MRVAAWWARTKASTPPFTDGGPGVYAESAIRNIGGVRVALQVTSGGFVDTASVAPAHPGSRVVYFSGQGCEGTAYLLTAYDAEVTPASIIRPMAPLVQDATTINGVAYYLKPSVYNSPTLSEGAPTTVCSVLYDTGPNGCQPLGRGECIGITLIQPATVLNLNTLNLTPPFSVR